MSGGCEHDEPSEATIGFGVQSNSLASKLFKVGLSAICLGELVEEVAHPQVDAMRAIGSQWPLALRGRELGQHAGRA